MITNYIKQNLINPTCLSCGSFFVKSHLFCDYCFVHKIEPRLDFKKVEQDLNADVYTLFSWIPFESDIISELVYRMKKGRCAMALNFYSNQAIRALSYEISNQKVDFIVPIPGSTTSSNHGYLMAQYSSEQLQVPVLDILKRAPVDPHLPEQKLKSKKARAQNSMVLHEQITESELASKLKNKRILVVDDIITTGSSFIQAKSVLRAAKSVTLLTLFHRLEKTNTTLVS